MAGPVWDRLASGNDVMFDFDQYDRTRHQVSPERLIATYQPIKAVRALSFLWWGEHCMECAAPQCYESCALYMPRADGGCRRLTWGFRRDRRFASLRSYGVDLAFATWGKIEADANTVLEPMARIIRRERVLAFSPNHRLAAWTRALHHDPSLVRDPTGKTLPPDPRRVAKKLMLRRCMAPNNSAMATTVSDAPEAFVAELYNPQPEAIVLGVTYRIKNDHPLGPNGEPLPPMLARLKAPPGYSLHIIGREHFAHLLGANQPSKISIQPEADTAPRLVFLTLDFVAGIDQADWQRAIPAAATEAPSPSGGPPIKCVVFDLDNTLWDGVLVESDHRRGQHLRLRPEIVETMRRLDARGILISVASRNDLEVAWTQLERFGIADLVLHPQIDWGPKSQHLLQIARHLNLGLDSFAFVDDSPFERTEVSSALPEVLTVTPEMAPRLLSDPRFAGSASREAGNRRRLYHEDLARRRDQCQWGNDYLGFLKSCEIELQIDPIADDDVARVIELVQRTNQLNYSGSKYSSKEVEDLISSNVTDKLVLRCRDRFGDYGTVGFAVVRHADNRVVVEEFMLSCRVQGRMLEQALFASLLARTANLGTSLWVRFRATGRNGPAVQVLSELGFVKDASGDWLVKDADTRTLDVDVVRVFESTSAKPS